MVSVMLVSSRIRLWAKFTAVLWSIVPIGCHHSTPISSTANAIPVRLRGDTIFGRILSSARNAIGNARVQVSTRKPGGGDSLLATVFSEKDGTFRISGLPPRSYHFAVRAIGYRPTDGEVRVSPSGSASLSVQLEPNVMRLEELAPPERQELWGAPFRQAPGLRIQLIVVASAPDSQGLHPERVRLGLAANLSDSFGDFIIPLEYPPCTVWDSSRVEQAILRVAIMRPKSCTGNRRADLTKSPIWLSLSLPASVRLVLGFDSATVRLFGPTGVARGIIPITVEPPRNVFLPPRMQIGAIPWGSVLVRCIPGKYPGTLCEGFADAFPDFVHTSYMRPMQYWSVGALPPYHDPTKPIDPSQFKREVISLDGWVPTTMERMRERSARFTALFLSVRVEITTALGVTVVCDSGACTQARYDPASPPN
jgi:hypothetical protein